MSSDDHQVCVSGRTALFLHNWEDLTRDPFVLSMVKGVELDFLHTPVQSHYPGCLVPDHEKELVDIEISKLLQKGVIEEVDPCEGQFILNIFLRPKKNGSMRPIINLKRLTQCIDTPHFKMEHLLSFLPFIRKGMFMTSLDLKDAYFALPIDAAFRKYIRFFWKNKLYEFQCLCFGLSSAPYIFTKVMKPIFSQLRREGICNSYYIDDSIYANLTATQLSMQTNRAKALLESLGFIINLEKSSLRPSQIIEHLGFIINTLLMTVSLPAVKVEKIRKLCAKLLEQPTVLLREIAQITGLIVSSFLAIHHGRLHYRELEFFKLEHLDTEENYDKAVHLTAPVKSELQWWVDNAHTSNGRSIAAILSMEEFQQDLYSDASKKGWGCALTLRGKVINRCSGQWSPAEAREHINVLELQAIMFGLQSFKKTLAKSVRIHCDNTTAIAYVNKFGGCHNKALNDLSKRLWRWCIEKNVNIMAVHIAGTDNVMADSLSREFNTSVEWSLNRKVFDKMCIALGQPDIDLFASRLNHKLDRYVSWKPDPDSLACNAFSIEWTGLYGYAFPPFNMIGRVLWKIEHSATAILLVCPYWPSQPWFPHLCSLLIARPVLLPSSPSLLRCPIQEIAHPMLPRLKLIACLLSRSNFHRLAYRKRLSASLHLDGNPQLNETTPRPSDNGCSFATHLGTIQAAQLYQL